MKNSSGPYMQKAGRGNMEGTGRGLPTELTGPKMHEGELHTDPKTTKTQEKATQGNQTGTLTTFTTKTPGSGGDSLSGEIIRTPEGDAAYEAKTPAERTAQDAKFKALNPRVPGSTNISSRFNPDATPPLTTPEPPVNIPTPPVGITRIARPKPMYSIKSSKGGGVKNPGNRRGVSGFNQTSPGGSPNDMIRTGLYARPGDKAEASKHYNFVDAHNQSLTDRNSSEAITKNFTERHGPVTNERMQTHLNNRIAKGQKRIDSNLATIDVEQISLSEAVKMSEKNKAGLRKYGRKYTGQE